MKETRISKSSRTLKPFIDTILEETPDYNRVVLLERLKRQGYRGSIIILRNYAAIKTAEINSKAVIRFDPVPGFQAQVDWKVHGTRIIDGKKQILYAFAMVFGYSRAPFVIHTTCMDQAPLLACHILAFEVLTWQKRLLDAVYPVLFLDCIVIKVRENKRVINKSVFLALAINSESKKDLLGLWLSENEGLKFWMSILTEICIAE